MVKSERGDEVMIKLITTVTTVNYEGLLIIGGVFILSTVIMLFFVFYNRTKSKNAKLSYIEGTLVRKIKDDQNEERNVRNIAGTRAFGLLHNWQKDGEYARYYITFKTNKGSRSFTVSKKIYNNIKKNQKGTLCIRGKKFVSFRVAK